MCCPHPRAGSCPTQGQGLGISWDLEKERGLESSVLLQRALSGERSEGPRGHPPPVVQQALQDLTPGTMGPPPPPARLAPRSPGAPLRPQGVRSRRLSGSRPPPPPAETHECPKRAKQTISGLVSPGTAGITNATNANCPPRVATRLFVSPAFTAQHGRTRSCRGRLASA